MPNFTPIDLGPSAPEEMRTGPSGRLHVKMFRLADDAITEATTDIELAREFIAHGELSAKSIQNSPEGAVPLPDLVPRRGEEDPGPAERRRPQRLQGIPARSAAGMGLDHQMAAHDPRYRPFTGPLSDPSRRQAMIAVKGLLGLPSRPATCAAIRARWCAMCVRPWPAASRAT
jgi:integrase/recombinase XerD